MKSVKRLLSFILVPVVLVSVLSPVFPAKADDLIVQNDGAVVLVITNNQVLAESTAKTAPSQKNEPKPAAKTVTLSPANVQSVVKISPKPTKDKKIEVTVSVGVNVQKQTVKTPGSVPPGAVASAVPSPQGTGGTTPATLTVPSGPTGGTTGGNIVRTVDKVVAEGINGKSILTITPSNAGQLMISQENTQVSTALPLSIDTVTHVMSNESSQISVLPREAALGASTKVNSGIDKISLTSDNLGLIYNIRGTEKGQLLGIVPVQSSVEVGLSAQTGQIVRTSQSPIFDLFGFLIQ